jgi:hypothetical protein
MKKEEINLNVSLKNTLSIETPNKKKIFQTGYILRKVSKFVVGAGEDALLPIQIFYDPETGKILKESIPLDLRDEYKNDII